jgi:hypothetical protein
MSDGSRSYNPLGEKGIPRSLLLYIIRNIVKNHGGSVEIDEKTETFAVTIPESRKAACIRELREIIGARKPLSESYFFLH